MPTPKKGLKHVTIRNDIKFVNVIFFIIESFKCNINKLHCIHINIIIETENAQMIK